MSKLNKYKLDTLYEISSGISTKPEQYGNGTPFLSFSTIFSNYFIPDELKELMNTTEKEQELYSIKKGDIFLTRTSETLNELAMSCVALKDYPQATFSGFAKRLRPIQKNITYDKFMGFFLRSKYFRKIIDNNAIMTLRASFNEKIFSYLNVELPEYEEQVKIGNLLHFIEEKIKTNNKINIELEKLAKTLYEYWFVQFDFPDENERPYKSSGGKMIYNEILKREIPIDWEVKTIEQNIKKSFSSKKISSNNYQNYGKIPIIDQSPQFICGYTNDVDYLIKYDKKPYIVFGDHSCTLKLVNFDFARGADGTQIIICGNENINQYYLYFAIKNIKLSSSYERHYKYLKDSKIVIPNNTNLTNKFEIITDDIYANIRKNIQENNLLVLLRDFLLPMLMNGQVSIIAE